MTDDPLVRVNDAALQTHRAHIARDKAILDAHEAGFSFATIAEFALISSTRVAQIVKQGDVVPDRLREIGERQSKLTRDLRVARNVRKLLDEKEAS